MISIKDFNKADVLAALYNHSKPQGLGFLNYIPNRMTREEAQELLDANPRKYFDYLYGRVLKIDLSTDELDPRLYDRDLGNGAAQRVIDKLHEELTKPT